MGLISEMISRKGFLFEGNLMNFLKKTDLCYSYLNSSFGKQKSLLKKMMFWSFGMSWVGKIEGLHRTPRSFLPMKSFQSLKLQSLFKLQNELRF